MKDMSGETRAIIVGVGNDSEWIRKTLYNTIVSGKALFYDSLYELFDNRIELYAYKVLFEKIKRDPLGIRRLLYRRICCKCIPNDRNIKYFIIYNHNRVAMDNGFLEYIKSKYPNLKTVLVTVAVMHSNAKAWEPYNKTIDDIKKMYDIVTTYDKRESDEYGIVHIPFVYNTNDCFEKNNVDYDLVYVGNAKDRLESIHAIYDTLSRAGFKLCFYVFGVEASDQKYEGINYNTWISYEDVLSLTKQSKAVLELLEYGQSFSTIKYAETIVYNKKCITNNKALPFDPLYDPDYVYILDYDKRSLFDFLNYNGIIKKQHPKLELLTSREFISEMEKNIQ